MYNFKENLDSDEYILYEGRGEKNKSGTNIKSIIITIAFIALMQIMLCYVMKRDGINLSAIFVQIILLIFQLLMINAIYYHLYGKHKDLEDDYYCITNKRALKYESKTNKLVYGYLSKYEDMKLQSVNGNYADLYMGIIYKSIDNGKEDMKALYKLMKDPNPKDMPCIQFTSIKDAQMVLNIAKNARQKLLEDVLKK